MRIGINTLVAVPSQTGGVKTYLSKLIEALAKIDKLNEYILFVAPWNKDLFRVRQKNFQQIICNVPGKFLAIRVLYEQAVLPILAWRNKIDVLHSPASVSPFILPCPCVLTLHDVTSFVFPELTPTISRYYWNIVFKISARLANLIITASHSAKRDIIKFLGVSEEKIEIIYHGSEPEISDLQNKSHLGLVQNKGKGDAPYILWVGKMYNHKNLTRLLYAYKRLKKTYQNISHRLVLCGMKGWGYSSLIRTIEELALEDKVVFTDYVPDDVLISIYAAASLFVFPSLIEGFGFPVLEAMSCRVPVITSNCGAMAEIAGEAALLVDPYNVEEIAEAMHKVLVDKNLRKNLIEKGLKRAREFSWEKAARETLNVYQKAYRR